MIFFMSRCFAYNCSAIFGQFIYTYIYLNEDQVNAVNYTTTLKFSIGNEIGKESGIKLWYGLPLLFEVNTTFELGCLGIDGLLCLRFKNCKYINFFLYFLFLSWIINDSYER